MKPCLLALLVISVMIVCSTETTIDDKFVQQILSDPRLSEMLKDPEKLMGMLKEELRSSSRYSNRCSVDTSKRHTIIKTKESVAAGAIFLSAITVDSSQSCVDACCANSSCDTAIMRHKVW